MSFLRYVIKDCKLSRLVNYTGSTVASVTTGQSRFNIHVNSYIFINSRSKQRLPTKYTFMESFVVDLSGVDGSLTSQNVVTEPD